MRLCRDLVKYYKQLSFIVLITLIDRSRKKTVLEVRFSAYSLIKRKDGAK